MKSFLVIRLDELDDRSRKKKKKKKVPEETEY